jgi:hypothetical protein
MSSRLSSAATSVAADQIKREGVMRSTIIREEIGVALGLWVAGLIPLAIVCFLSVF